MGTAAYHSHCLCCLQGRRAPSGWIFPPPFFFFLRDLYLFLGGGREKERERNINVWLLLAHPLVGTWPATQARALTWNPAGHHLVCSPAFNPLRHTSQVQIFPFLMRFLCSISQFLNVGRNPDVHVQSPELRTAPQTRNRDEESTGHTQEGTEWLWSAGRDECAKRGLDPAARARLLLGGVGRRERGWGWGDRGQLAPT